MLRGRRYVPEAAEGGASASASAPGLGLGYSNLDELIKRVEIALGEALPPPAKDDKSTQDKVPYRCLAGLLSMGGMPGEGGHARQEGAGMHGKGIPFCRNKMASRIRVPSASPMRRSAP